MPIGIGQMEVPLSPGAMLRWGRRIPCSEHGLIEHIDIVNAKDRTAPPGRAMARREGEIDQGIPSLGGRVVCAAGLEGVKRIRPEASTTTSLVLSGYKSPLPPSRVDFFLGMHHTHAQIERQLARRWGSTRWRRRSASSRLILFSLLASQKGDDLCLP